MIGGGEEVLSRSAVQEAARAPPDLFSPTDNETTWSAVARPVEEEPASWRWTWKEALRVVASVVTIAWESYEAAVLRGVAVVLAWAVAGPMPLVVVVGAGIAIAADEAMRDAVTEAVDWGFLVRRPPPEKKEDASPTRAVGGGGGGGPAAFFAAHLPRRTKHRRRRCFSGRWRLDRKRSDSQSAQLKALGAPWAARAALARSSMTKRIRYVANEASWVEVTTTAIITRSQTLRVDESEHVDAHPIDGSRVRSWSAVGVRPAKSPAAHERVAPPPPGAVVTVMAYERTTNNSAQANVATIYRTLVDGGDTYHVVNHLVLAATDTHVVTHSFFTREDDDDEGGDDEGADDAGADDEGASSSEMIMRLPWT